MMKFLNRVFTPEEQKIIVFLLVFALIGITIKYTRLIAEDREEHITREILEKDYQVRYDLRTASREQLLNIPGIGEKRAETILNYRQESGFQSTEDLMKIKGIGPVTFEKMRAYLIDFGPEQLQDESLPAGIETEGTVVSENLQTVNLNSATALELTALKGIGPAKAERIISYRNEHGRFKTVDELINIKGIGQKTLDKIREQLYLGDVK